MPLVLLMTDDRRLANPEAAIGRLPPGSAVIFRHYDAPDRLTVARWLKHVCCRHNVHFLVAADPRLAVAVRADGLHLPEPLLRQGSRRWRRWRRRRWLVTAAAHSPSAIRRAASAGVDAVLVSPVFATASHPDAVTLGVLRFARLCRTAPVPVYALGGVGVHTVIRLKGVHISGIAGISGLDEAARTRCVRALRFPRRVRHCGP